MLTQQNVLGDIYTFRHLHMWWGLTERFPNKFKVQKVVPHCYPEHLSILKNSENSSRLPSLKNPSPNKFFSAWAALGVC